MGALPILKFSGIQSAHNPFSGVADGGLAVARNVGIFSNNVLEPRRGWRQFSYTTASDTDLSNSGGFYGSTLVVQVGTSALVYDTGSAFTAYTGTYEPVDDASLRMKFVEAKENLYVNTNAGSYALESSTGTPRMAGLPRPVITAELTSVDDALGGDFQPGDRIVIRATYVYTDANGNEIESAPSSWNYLEELAPSDNGSLVITHTFPDSVPSGTKLRVYGGDVGVETDELFLVYETELEEIQISRYSPSSTPLYTNPRTGGGIGDANDRPPIAKDMTYAMNRMWYVNTTSPQRLILSLLGTGSPDGVQAGDTITIAGVTFTARASPTLDTEFTLLTSGTPSENITATTKGLIAAVNAYPDLGVSAYGLAVSSTQAIGDILFESTTLGADPFYVYGSRDTSWNPELPSTEETALASDPNRLKNAVFYSKLDQPEAVPLLNYLLIGAENKEALRAHQLREKVFVFKEDGVYTISGEAPFTVDALDAKTRLITPDSLVSCNNQLLCFTNQGIVAVSDGGVQILSRPIEDELLPYMTDSVRTNVGRYGFGVSHETDRTYELWLPGPGATDSRVCNKAFVFSPITQTWVTWDGSENTWGAVSPTDVRHYGSTDDKVLYERRDFASTDYAGETLSVTVSAYGDSTLTVSSTTGIEVGDAFTVEKGGGSQSVIVTEVTDATHIEITEPIITGYQTGGTTYIEKAIECEVELLPVAFDRPGSAKRFQYGTLHFGQPSTFYAAYATYCTELQPVNSEETMQSLSLGWGYSAWGSSNWGDPYKNLNLRHTIPGEKQRATMIRPGFYIKEALAGWKLHGFTLDTEETSNRNSRGE